MVIIGDKIWYWYVMGKIDSLIDGNDWNNLIYLNNKKDDNL